MKKVSRLGPKAFEQAAGFLRIPGGKNPLDASAVHPESYGIVEAMATDLASSVTQLMSDETVSKGIQLNRYATDTVGLPTLRDIMSELAKPGRDPREKFEAFNFAETYRVPVFVLLDECVGHMTERVVIPEADEIQVVPRVLTKKPVGEYLPYDLNGGTVPEMVAPGQGHRFHTTGLTHDERGYPDMTVETQDKLVRRLSSKILDSTDDIVMIEEMELDDAEVVIVAYGKNRQLGILVFRFKRSPGNG